MLTQDIHEYPFVSQGKTDIPGVDDNEEFRLTDVSISLQARITIIFIINNSSSSSSIINLMIVFLLQTLWFL